MRIACLHLPAFPLQVVLRAERHRRGDAVAVVGPGSRATVFPVITACSRAARAAGVSVGMAAATARLAPDVAIVSADPAGERAALLAIAEALRSLSPRVDLGASTGPHHAIFCEVPARTRGAAFGARVHELCEVMGVSGRVGIADDRFTAQVAASWSGADDGSGTVSVPRGGSAAFLAPLPLSLLAISNEVRHMLETLGVHTLGEFAALPPPSVARPVDADWQSLARGDGGAPLRAFTPAGTIRERVAIAPGGGLGVAVGVLAARLAARLRGRDAVAAAIDLVVDGEAPMTLAPAAPLTEAAELADAIGAAASGRAGTAAWIEARVREPATIEPGLAETPAAGGTIAAPVLAEGSARVAAPAPRVIVTAVPREPHRRTRRGKERPRVVPAQAALFSA